MRSTFAGPCHPCGVVNQGQGRPGSQVCMYLHAYLPGTLTLAAVLWELGARPWISCSLWKEGTPHSIGMLRKRERGLPYWVAMIDGSSSMSSQVEFKKVFRLAFNCRNAGQLGSLHHPWASPCRRTPACCTTLLRRLLLSHITPRTACMAQLNGILARFRRDDVDFWKRCIRAGRCLCDDMKRGLPCFAFFVFRSP